MPVFTLLHVRHKFIHSSRMFIRTAFIVFLGTVLCLPLSAQKQGHDLIDSLRARLDLMAEDTSKVRLLGTLSFQYFRFDTDSGIEYGRRALDLAEKLQWSTGIAFSNNYLGTNYAVKGAYPKALEYFTKSLAKFTEIGDKQGIAFLANNLGNLFRIQKQYPKAIGYLNQAAAINKELDNKRDLVKNYNNLGFAYSGMTEFAKSNEIYDKALGIAREIGNKELTAQILINIAENKMKLKDFCGALAMAMEALRISDTLKIDYDRAVFTSLIGEIYLRLSDGAPAAPAGCPGYSNDAPTNLLAAKKYLLRSLALLGRINDLELSSKTSFLLSEVYERLGDTGNALKYYKRYAADKDSAFSKDNTIMIANMEKQREIEARDKQIIIQSLDLEKKNAQIVSQIVLFIAILLLTSLIPYFYYKKQKRQKEIKADLEKQIADRALRESEERYRALYEEAPVGLYRTAADGTIVLANRMLRSMLGYASFEELRGRAITQLRSGACAKPEAHSERSHASGGTSDAEEKWIRADGKAILVKEHVNVVRNSDRAILYCDGTVEDITEYKHLQQQLLQAQKLEGVGTLAGGIAHDFNNLLAMILASAEMLRRQSENRPDLIRYADRIIEMSERGTSISRQLLIFSRPGEAELKPISVSQIIAELKEMLKHFLPKTITIVVECTTGGRMIMGDPGQIHQALLNLAINAGDAMTNMGTLTIREFNASPMLMRSKFGVEGTREYIGVSVTDTGRGMDAQLIEKIFEPFFSTKERGKGTGLGLAMVHGIVKNHDGFIDLNSAPGEGTTFTLYFPAIAQTEGTAAEESLHNEQKSDETILLVDDEAALCEMLSEYLRGSGYRVLTASNGIEAIDMYRKHHAEIDLIITDLGMPEMGGKELFLMLRQIDPNVKVIIASGYLDGTPKNELLEMGFKDILSKPFKMRNIRSAVRAVLDNRERALEK